MAFMYVVFFLVFCVLVWFSLPFWKWIGSKVMNQTNKSFNEEVGKNESQHERSTEETQGNP